MDYIVIDMEWNQPLVEKKRVRGLFGEIIQIGAVKTDISMNITDTFERLIKPHYYQKINKEIKELTLLTEEDLEKGISFQEAIKEFREWCGEECILITWGGTDNSMLKNNLKMYGMDTEWIPKTIDAQIVFDDQFTQEDRSFALNYALYYFDEKPDGAHNAVADAISTVKVLRHLDMEDAVSDEYYYIEK